MNCVGSSSKELPTKNLLHKRRSWRPCCGGLHGEAPSFPACEGRIQERVFQIQLVVLMQVKRQAAGVPLPAFQLRSYCWIGGGREGPIFCFLMFLRFLLARILQPSDEYWKFR